ncbi:RHS repeat-associated core domain-containing protein, partial [Pseudoalteromonas fuliginea]|uniref:RHS repeat domain-containing protein n=1 Tax=Pseudoalteromonas fuliginea TaxID=1872678 RepID=UPI003180D4DA
ISKYFRMSYLLVGYGQWCTCIMNSGYNAFNQLSCFNNNGTLTQYDYDPLGRRIAKHTEHGKIDYIWDNDQLIGECQHGEYNWYINLPNQFHPVALIKQGEVYYYHLDQLNTPRFVTNNKAEVVWENQADVYGYEEPEAESNFNKEISFTQPIRFQGQYLDEESGLHYNRYRYYSPKQQRFINQDPIGLVGGINHYQYAPNPVNWVDPFGLSCKENTWNTFQRNTKGHFKNSSEAAASYQAMKGVRKLDNKLRANVSDYLPQSYIDAHEAKFAGGAAYFTPKWALDEFGRSVVGRPDGQFVMTKTQMDGILTRSSGDMALIEEELGIPAGGWQKNEMVIIEVSDPNKHNVRIPTGREDGANELWLPGGKLPTGHDEAVIDAIPEGSYKELSIAEAVNSTKNAKEKT